jgi:uncharacterized phage-associated protein
MSDLVAPAVVADYLLVECRERGEVLTNLKLQKLIYYAQAWELALRNRELFAEDCQAWIHGPVVPSQYHRFRDFQWRPITAEISRPALPEDVRSHLNEIVDVFGTDSAVALELMTHREPPWLEARGDLPPDVPSTNRISKTTMRDYYRSLDGDT